MTLPKLAFSPTLPRYNMTFYKYDKVVIVRPPPSFHKYDKHFWKYYCLKDRMNILFHFICLHLLAKLDLEKEKKKIFYFEGFHKPYFLQDLIFYCVGTMCQILPYPLPPLSFVIFENLFGNMILVWQPPTYFDSVMISAG